MGNSPYEAKPTQWEPFNANNQEIDIKKLSKFDAAMFIHPKCTLNVLKKPIF